MRNTGFVIAFTLFVMLTACSKEKPPESASTHKQDLSKVGSDNIFQPQVDALQKAQQVQKDLDKAAEDQRREIDKQF